MEHIKGMAGSGNRYIFFHFGAFLFLIQFIAPRFSATAHIFNALVISKLQRARRVITKRDFSLGSSAQGRNPKWTIQLVSELGVIFNSSVTRSNPTWLLLYKYRPHIHTRLLLYFASKDVLTTRLLLLLQVSARCKTYKLVKIALPYFLKITSSDKENCYSQKTINHGFLDIRSIVHEDEVLFTNSCEYRKFQS